jgi:hypothetical protein
VLFGPYSNLAKKYLWQSLHNLHTELGGCGLDIIAASRDAQSDGLRKLLDIVRHNVSCSVAPCDAR